MQLYYKLVGKEIVPVSDVMEWAMSFQDNDNRVVKQTNIGKIFVSTVFLGIDHRWGDGKPVLFETMIFGGKQDQYQKRYCTYDESLAGHISACNKVKKANHYFNENKILKKQTIKTRKEWKTILKG